jgi:hypothetical protein
LFTSEQIGAVVGQSLFLMQYFPTPIEFPWSSGLPQAE